MKWLSRSRQFMWPVVSSGTTTSAHFALPSWTAWRRDDRRAGRRRAAERHVEAVAARADRVLDLDRDRGVQPLQVRRAEHDEVDVLAGAARARERALRGVDRVLGLDAELILGPVRDVRAHPLGIEQAGLVLRRSAA